MFVIPWTYAPVASKLGVALQGNPPPTPLYAAHRFAQRGFPRRLGPSRFALSTLNEILKQHFKKTNTKLKRAGIEQTIVRVCVIP